jgi:PhnB protein
MAKKNVKKATKKVVKKTTKKVAKKATPVKAVKKAAAKKIANKVAIKAEPKTNAINPYLVFKDNCEAAFNLYKSVFGGKFTYVGRFKEMPATDGKPLPASEGEKIMHISLPISKETILMGSDSSEAFGHATVIGNNFSISINAKSQKEADRLYNGLSAGGKTIMPMSKTFWGSYFGMLQDKFGIQWQVSFGQ